MGRPGSASDLDWHRIHRAAADRERALRLTHPVLAQRAEVSGKTITNLFTRTVNATTLAAVSEALEWPSDGLEQIGRGRDPASLPDCPWEPELTTEERLMALLDTVRRQVGSLAERVDRLERQLPPSPSAGPDHRDSR